MKLTQKQIDTRVAILKRLKTLLQEEKKKFQDYLLALEKQQAKIENEDIDALTRHSVLEEKIVGNIAALQKVIAPMNDMYQFTLGKKKVDPQILQIQLELSTLQKKVMKQNEYNQAMLEEHILLAKTQLKELCNPYHNAKSIYAATNDIGQVIHINA